MSQKNKLFKRIKMMNDPKIFILNNNFKFNKFLINFYYNKKKKIIVKFFFSLYNHKIIKKINNL